MPFIPDFRRNRIHAGEKPDNPGELAYQLYRVILTYVDSRRSFYHFAHVLGAIEAAKLELYRREVAPYEDKKREENGDVFPAA